MTLQPIPIKNDQALHCISDQILIRTEQDALDLIGETNFQPIILHDFNFEPDFFDLSTRKLGAILQKFTNYRVRLAIIGDLSVYKSSTLPDFIRESNRHKDYLFVDSLAEVRRIWGEF